jgi:hypothetical protein
MSELNDNHPTVRPGDQVIIGHRALGQAPLKGIVTDNIHDHEVEVVYLDHLDRAINENIYWHNDQWNLKDALGGGYADHFPRLRDFVYILRSK